MDGTPAVKGIPPPTYVSVPSAEDTTAADARGSHGAGIGAVVHGPDAEGAVEKRFMDWARGVPSGSHVYAGV